MKRFFVCFAVLSAMLFMVGCGGTDNNSGGGSSNTLFVHMESMNVTATIPISAVIRAMI